MRLRSLSSILLCLPLTALACTDDSDDPGDEVGDTGESGTGSGTDGSEAEAGTEASTDTGSTSTDTGSTDTGTGSTDTGSTDTSGETDTGTDTAPNADCDPQQIIPVGDCEVPLGWAWNGEACVEVSGCECAGPDCDKLYDSLELCIDDHALCELTNPCAVDDAFAEGDCPDSFGFAWTTDGCVEIVGCECVGLDCPWLPPTLAVCEEAHAECGDIPPNPCAALDEAECLDTAGCMTLSGSPLQDIDGGVCLAEPSFQGCAEDSLCGEALTWACPEGQSNPHLFPNTCIPAGWTACEPDNLDAEPC